jgi:hypothetical protein
MILVDVIMRCVVVIKRVKLIVAVMMIVLDMNLLLLPGDLVVIIKMTFKLDDIKIGIETEQRVIVKYDFIKQNYILNCAPQPSCVCQSFCGCEDDKCPEDQYCASY